MGDFSEAAEQQIAKNLMGELKEGKYDQVDKELNAIPIDERVKIAKMMEATSAADPSHKDFPDLKISTSKDPGGTEHLTGLKVEGHWMGQANSFWSHDAFHEKGDGTFVPQGITNAEDTQMNQALKQIYEGARNELHGALTPGQEVEMAKAVGEAIKARTGGQAIPEDTDIQKAVKKALDGQSGTL